MDTTVYLEAYRQAFDTMRYYGNLRFTVLTAFIIITGGLLAVAFKNSDQPPKQFYLPCIAGGLVAIVFLCFEIRIGENFEFYANQTKVIGRAAPLNMRTETTDLPSQGLAWQGIVMALMGLVYGGSVVMWGYML